MGSAYWGISDKQPCVPTLIRTAALTFPLGLIARGLTTVLTLQSDSMSLGEYNQWCVGRCINARRSWDNDIYFLFWFLYRYNVTNKKYADLSRVKGCMYCSLIVQLSSVLIHEAKRDSLLTWRFIHRLMFIENDIYIIYIYIIYAIYIYELEL